EPDVILAPWSGVTAEQYKQLDDIAPTVAYPEQPWTSEWDDQITTIGKALGHGEESEGLVDDIKEQLSDAKRAEYEGLTFSLVYHRGPGALGAAAATAQRCALRSGLGLPRAPGLEERKDDSHEPGSGSALLGLEHADYLTAADVLFPFGCDDENGKEGES